MNENGWGLRWELVIILVLVICLLIATIGLNNFGLLSDDDVIYFGGKSNDNFSYVGLENKIENAALRYFEDKYNGKINETITVSTRVLNNGGYLSELTDGNNKACKGYAKILKTGTTIGYVKCNRYRTEGYDADYE